MLKKYRLWLDDVRPIPEWMENSNCIWYNTAEAMIANMDRLNRLFSLDDIEFISLDNDLGEGRIEGYKVLDWLARAGYSKDEVETADPKKCSWFKDECLTAAEMAAIMKKVKGESVDFVLSHTCPLSWEPTDLFLNGIDQSTVDKSMEVWLDELKDDVKWKYYLFGHYHADRIERPYVEQFYQEYEDVESIIARWNKYDETGELNW